MRDLDNGFRQRVGPQSVRLRLANKIQLLTSTLVGPNSRLVAGPDLLGSRDSSGAQEHPKVVQAIRQNG